MPCIEKGHSHIPWFLPVRPRCSGTYSAQRMLWVVMSRRETDTSSGYIGKLPLLFSFPALLERYCRSFQCSPRAKGRPAMLRRKTAPGLALAPIPLHHTAILFSVRPRLSRRRDNDL